jgi:hypothetical protein
MAGPSTVSRLSGIHFLIANWATPDGLRLGPRRSSTAQLVHSMLPTIAWIGAPHFLASRCQHSPNAPQPTASGIVTRSRFSNRTHSTIIPHTNSDAQAHRHLTPLTAKSNRSEPHSQPVPRPLQTEESRRGSRPDSAVRSAVSLPRCPGRAYQYTCQGRRRDPPSPFQ